uniref:NR LBD domain-containing protein n=1 Tax=Parascaris univalens TaxID=6257 RepID=A0A915A6R8_PARUN
MDKPASMAGCHAVYTVCISRHSANQFSKYRRRSFILKSTASDSFLTERISLQTMFGLLHGKIAIPTLLFLKIRTHTKLLNCNRNESRAHTVQITTRSSHQRGSLSSLNSVRRKMVEELEREIEGTEMSSNGFPHCAADLPQTF